jgi:hypothetical protein
MCRIRPEAVGVTGIRAQGGLKVGPILVMPVGVGIYMV